MPEWAHPKWGEVPIGQDGRITLIRDRGSGVGRAPSLVWIVGVEVLSSPSSPRPREGALGPRESLPRPEPLRLDTLKLLIRSDLRSLAPPTEGAGDPLGLAG